MRRFMCTAVAASLLFANATSAQDRFVFGTTPAGTQTLVTNVGTVSAVQSGWFDRTGLHVAGNGNYFTGDLCSYNLCDLRSFWTFSTGSLVGTTSARLRISNNNSYGTAPYVVTLWDVSSTIDTNLDYRGRTDIHTDLGSGVQFGHATLAAPFYFGSGPPQYVSFQLNAAAIAAINAAAVNGNSITFGARLEPAGFTIPGVPEPQSWATLLLGFGLTGMVMRRRRRLETTTA